ncbi:MAG: anthranilate synthase component [bacterium]|nr:anthranilate synthase component [bacterium]
MEKEIKTIYISLPLPANFYSPEILKNLLSETSHSFVMSVDASYRGGKKYTYIGANPHKVLKLYKKNNNFFYEVNGHIREDRGSDFEQLLEKEIAFQKFPKELPPFCGGLFGYIGYEMIDRWEELYHAEHHRKLKTLDLPTAYFGLFKDIIAIDHENQKLYVIKNFEKGEDEKTVLTRLFREASFMIEKALRGAEENTETEEFFYIRNFVSNTRRKEYLKMVEEAKNYILAGEIFQIVISQRFSFESNIDPIDLLFALENENPSPYMFLINFPEIKLIGSSPEILVEVKDKRVVTRPLAGTRKRGKNPQEDKYLEKELIEDIKEKAEHVMLVDLARNDLGRVCKPGSVVAPELMKIEYYPHVMHIASQVEGDLRDDKTLIDVLKATFPAGTVTGAPKVRAMELINDLEKEARGPYAGAVGYLGFHGNMEMCISIRTIYFFNDRFHIQTGAGIVSDSKPETEYEETLHKARGLFKAVKRVIENRHHKQPLTKIKEG